MLPHKILGLSLSYASFTHMQEACMTALLVLLVLEIYRDGIVSVCLM
jgi:hypothetical protein